MECEDFFTSEGIILEDYTQFEWKNLVTTKIYKLNINDILIQMKALKKISYNAFQLQPYMTNLNIAEARSIFKLKTRMTLL